MNILTLTYLDTLFIILGLVCGAALVGCRRGIGVEFKMPDRVWVCTGGPALVAGLLWNSYATDWLTRPILIGVAAVLLGLGVGFVAVAARFLTVPEPPTGAQLPTSSEPC